MGGDGEVETTEGMEGVCVCVGGGGGGRGEKGEGGGGVAAIHPRAHNYAHLETEEDGERAGVLSAARRRLEPQI